MSESQLSHLSVHYLAALRTHLEQGRQTSLLPAYDLGTEAVNVGLETLDLAKVHHQALETLILPVCSSVTRDEMTLRAEVFFTEASVPIEKNTPPRLRSPCRVAAATEALGTAHHGSGEFQS
jgi:hypothetical protein